ncbi:hypothetical protein Enr13x_41270 [Stieleria neptunia]|uniref:Uncharacterized protein n=1 Tax=Stieleria neptunia TaxID=2527979 RepID=A0A518HTX9_9BACT|nr:hypothetical protein [Stieleria neptunia]QDV44263.1 hypothetical protein Enr13x_41270 [Stieleria neptunia]
MGVTNGDQLVWTWGSGANADSVTLNIGTTAIPEPDLSISVRVFLIVLAMFRWRRTGSIVAFGSTSSVTPTSLCINDNASRSASETSDFEIGAWIVERVRMTKGEKNGGKKFAWITSIAPVA